MPIEPCLYPLACGVQHYPWGQRRHGAQVPFIADLLGQAVVDDTPFAELWIGAHRKLPARVQTPAGAVPLDRFIAAHADAILGADQVARSGPQLPFLLKVLACDQALSIQAHPDEARAAQLHAAAPGRYPDPHAKPEIAIAITPFEALAQFRAIADIRRDFRRLPALGTFFAAELVSATRGRAWLRAAYGKLFAAPAAQVREVSTALADGIRASLARTLHDGWFLELQALYPGDRGALSIYFLNLVHLEPGEAIFLGANEPHAYLRGTIIECMANSDNVVRAGLTTKPIDTAVLLDMLSYKAAEPLHLAGGTASAGDRLYVPPVPHFQVERWTQNAGVSRAVAAGGAVSLLLVLRGACRLRTPQATVVAAKGSTWLWPACVEQVTVDFIEDGTDVVRARPNLTPMTGK